MTILKDDGGGITKRSLQFWEYNKATIGKIERIEFSLNPLATITLSEGGFPYTVDYTFKALGERGEIWLSGCNCGYGGEGPHGTKKILVELGIKDDVADILVHGKYSNINMDAVHEMPTIKMKCYNCGEVFTSEVTEAEAEVILSAQEAFGGEIPESMCPICIGLIGR
jgi:hypothetical protein